MPAVCKPFAVVAACVTSLFVIGCEPTPVVDGERDVAVRLVQRGMTYRTSFRGRIVGVTVHATRMTDDDAKALASLSDLRRLRFYNRMANPQELEFVATLPQLRELKLDHLNDLRAASLPVLKQIVELDLTNTTVTDAAVDSLSKLTSLKRLDVSDTGITRTGLHKLRTALPGCEVEHRGFEVKS